MATTRSFQDMLNDYLPNRLLQEEHIKRDWLLTNCEIDNGWEGGQIKVPFRGAGNSSVEIGQLAASTDISQSQYGTGTISAYVEAWGSLILNHRDLMDHSGRIPETTFLKLIPNEIENLLAHFKESVSTALVSGTHIAKATADGTAGGLLEVDHIDRFEIGQKLSLDDDNSSPLTVYVKAININPTSPAANTTGQLTLSDTRGGSVVDVSAYTLTQNAKLYLPGAQAGGFNSLRASLLSSANGGSSTIHGITKTAWPITQATNISGASMSASNILDQIFDAYTATRQKGKGNANTVLMSFKHLGSVMKLLEAQKGPYVVTKSATASLYGWTEIEITTVRGSLKLVGLVEMDNDVIFFLDMKAIVFRTKGGFKKRMSPDGKEYFEVRATTGYSYVVDVCVFGELEVNKPGHCAVIHSISY